MICFEIMPDDISLTELSAKEYKIALPRVDPTVITV